MPEDDKTEKAGRRKTSRRSQKTEDGDEDPTSESVPLTTFTVKMLVLDEGKCPFEEWYNGIKDISTRARIRSRLIQLQRGAFGSGRHLGSGVAELKLDFGPGYRIYYARQGDTIVILIGGGDKSSQSEDIRKARQQWKDNQNDPERFQRDF